MNSVLQIAINSPNVTNKTLYVGCNNPTSLSNYSAFVAAGWSYTGSGMCEPCKG